MTIEDLKQTFKAGPDGRLFRIKYDRRLKRGEGEVGRSKSSKVEYCVTYLKGQQIPAHVLVFALHNNRWPVGQVDHVNHNKKDNRPENLRDASFCENRRNVGLYRSNKTGYKGVFKTAEGNYKVTIYLHGKPIRLGTFRDPEFAALVYDAAAERLHGAFAFTNLQLHQQSRTQPCTRHNAKP